MEHRRRRPREAGAGPRPRRPPPRGVRRWKGSCTAARASGTRASRCPGGTSVSSGAPTGCRCGRTPRCSPSPGWTPPTGRVRPTRTPARWPSGSPRCWACRAGAVASGVRGPVRGAGRPRADAARQASGRPPGGRPRGARPTGARPGGPARRRRHRAHRLGAAAGHRRGEDQPAVALPPRPAGADPGHERGRAAAAAGLDLVDRPRGDRPAVVPRGRPAAGAEGAERGGGRPRGCAHDGAGLRGPGRARARVPAADRAAGGLRRPAAPDRGVRAQGGPAGGARGLRPAAGPAADQPHRHPPTPVSSRSTCSRPGPGPSSAT